MSGIGRAARRPSAGARASPRAEADDATITRYCRTEAAPPPDAALSLALIDPADHVTFRQAERRESNGSRLQPRTPLHGTVARMEPGRLAERIRSGASGVSPNEVCVLTLGTCALDCRHVSGALSMEATEWLDYERIIVRANEESRRSLKVVP